MIPDPPDGPTLPLEDRTAESVYDEAVSERIGEEEFLRTVVDNTSDVVVTITEGSRIVFANPAVEEVFGYEPEDVVDESLMKLIPERLRGPHRDAVAQYLRTGQKQLDWDYIELPGLHREGHEVPLALSFREHVHDDRQLFTGVIRDVTKQKERERELREERSMVGSILTAMPDVFYLFDEEGTMRRWNDNLLDVTGYTDEEIAEMSALNFVAEEDRGKAAEVIGSAFEEGQVAPVELDLLTKDGERIPYEFSGASVTDDEGGVVGLTGVGRDVSERKEREEKLRQERELVERTLETAPVAFAVESPDGEVLRANGRAEELAEETAADPIYAPEKGVIYDAEGQSITVDELPSRRAQVSGDPVFNQEVAVEAPDGDRRWFLNSAAPVTDGTGDVDRVIVAAKEITERKRHEREVEKQRERLERELDEVFGRITDAVVGLDAEGRVSYLNNRAKTLFAREEGETTGTAAGEFFPSSGDGAFEEAFERARETGDRTGVGTFFPDLGDWYDVQFYPSETGLSVYFRDITRQKQYEETLTALQESSRELLYAETAADVGDRILATARDVLDIPGAVVYLRENGYLRPAAATDAAEELFGDVSAVTPDSETITWDAYTGGETVAVDDTQETESPDRYGSGVRSGIWIPLGRHGVLTAISGDPGAFDEEERQLADLLAASAEGILDRIHREQQLVERDRVLHEKNRRLERLNRINDVIRSIDQALVGADSRKEIEEAVCTRLTRDGPYAFAWVGEHDVAQDRVEVREWAGGEEGYLDAVRFPLGEVGSRDDPVGKAVRTREPQAVDDLVGDPPLPDWRREATKRGFRATIVIPVTYRGTLYGILAVYAHESGTFDELEQDVLSELGGTIGYAMNAVERKKALVSDELVEIEFAVRDPSIPLLALTAETDCELELVDIVSRPEGFRVYFTTRNADPDAVLASLDRPHVSAPRLVAERDDGHLFEAVFDESTFLGTLLDYGAVPRAFEVSGGEATVVVSLPKDANVRSFLATIGERYEGTELLARREHERDRRTWQGVKSELDDKLTDRQREVLRTAYFGGYFEAPRGSTGSELAEGLDVSQPTFNNHLRTAQRKIFDRLFDEE